MSKIAELRQLFREADAGRRLFEGGRQALADWEERGHDPDDVPSDLKHLLDEYVKSVRRED